MSTLPDVRPASLSLCRARPCLAKLPPHLALRPAFAAPHAPAPAQPRDIDNPPTAVIAAASCAKIVYCLNGQAQMNAEFDTPTGETCAKACDVQCCVGDRACDNGRFAVCADANDGSCSGIKGASAGSPFPPDISSVFLPDVFPLLVISSTQRATVLALTVAMSASSPEVAAMAIRVR